MGLYKKNVYPQIIESLLSNPSLMAHRKDILTHVRGDILEIGFGTGLNLPCYPDFVREITVLETNEGMNLLANERMRKSPIHVHFKLLSAETLPFQDKTFDSIVSTFTFCSIRNIDAAMKELYRVLKPNGQLLFLEHGLSPDKRVGFMQSFLNPFYKLFSDGCNLNRNMIHIIEKPGFKIISQEQFYEKGMIKLAGYLYKGIAIKE